jgi:hypothetical protein
VAALNAQSPAAAKQFNTFLVAQVQPISTVDASAG